MPRSNCLGLEFLKVGNSRGVSWMPRANFSGVGNTGVHFGCLGAIFVNSE